MRSAWNVRVAGVHAARTRAGPTARTIARRRSSVVPELAVDEGSADAARDATRRATLVAVLEDGVGELVVVEALDQLERGLARVRIHAHVDRPLATEAHAATRVVELRRAHPQVDAHAADALDPDRRELLPGAREVRAHERDPLAVGAEAVARFADGVRVAIERDHSSGGVGLEECLGVPTGAERRVGIHAARARRERLDDLVPHHRGVRRS